MLMRLLCCVMVMLLSEVCINSCLNLVVGMFCSGVINRLRLVLKLFEFLKKNEKLW